MSFRPSDFPGGHERHCLRQINHADLFDYHNGAPDDALAQAVAKDVAIAKQFFKDFEAALARAVALKPNEDTKVVLALKAELDRLYTVSASLCGEQTNVQEGLTRLIALTLQSIKRAAGDDALADKELSEERDARSLHIKQLQTPLLADLLNSDLDGEGFIPKDALIPTLLSSDKAVLADVVGLFDLTQVSDIICQSEAMLEALVASSSVGKHSAIIAYATQNLEFIKGYKVYLENYG